MLFMFMLVLERNFINLIKYNFLICSDCLSGECTPADFDTELAILNKEKYE